MNYQSQEEHDHFEGAMEQSVPQEEPMTNKFTEEKLKEANERFGTPYGYEIDDPAEFRDFLSQTIEEARKAEREEIKKLFDGVGYGTNGEGEKWYMKQDIDDIINSLNK